jgi:glutamate carboxypeptidase
VGDKGVIEALAALRGLRRQLLRDLKKFVELESPSDDKARTDVFAKFLEEYVTRRMRARVEIIPQTNVGSHIRIEVGPTGPAPSILVLGHFDTVWPAGTLGKMPFSVKGDIARGPGIFDMKAGLLLGLNAIAALDERRLLQGPVIFLCTSDEEIGSPTSRPLIEAEARACCAALVLEPSAGRALKTSRKGVSSFRIEVTGRAAHAGLDPKNGVSAIDEIAHMIIDLHHMTDYARGVTVNVGVVHGGTRPNVIAECAIADVDLRINTMADAHRVETAIRALKTNHPKAAVKITGGIDRPPMERTPAVAALYEMAKAIGEEIGIQLTETAVGGTSDGNFVSQFGIAVLDGLGAIGGGAHSSDEHVEVSSLETRSALFARLLVEIQAHRGQFSAGSQAQHGS